MLLLHNMLLLREVEHFPSKYTHTNQLITSIITADMYNAFTTVLCTSAILILCKCDKNKTSSQEQESDRRLPSMLADLCVCQPVNTCSSPVTVTDDASHIDIRIVTPPVGEECEPGFVYCCFAEHTYCGLRSGNISSFPVPGSGQAKFGDYPWQALLLDLDSKYVGSGAIVDQLHIVTAAHKVAGYNKTELVVRVGDWDVQSDREQFTPQDVRVINILTHPQYDPHTLSYDVAVLTLSQSLRLYPAVPHVNSICLPPPSVDFSGMDCWVSGWGKDAFGTGGNYQSIQKAVDVGVINSSECERQLRSTRLGRRFSLDRQSFLCAGGEKNKDACSGDGGAPLACANVGGRWYLAGLVAWGVGCGQPDIPGVYVNIPAMMQWLNQCLTPLA